jgi:hypothetical protein
LGNSSADSLSGTDDRVEVTEIRNSEQ